MNVNAHSWAPQPKTLIFTLSVLLNCYAGKSKMKAVITFISFSFHCICLQVSIMSGCRDIASISKEILSFRNDLFTWLGWLWLEYTQLSAVCVLVEVHTFIHMYSHSSLCKYRLKSGPHMSPHTTFSGSYWPQKVARVQAALNVVTTVNVQVKLYWHCIFSVVKNEIYFPSVWQQEKLSLVTSHNIPQHLEIMSSTLVHVRSKHW